MNLGDRTSTAVVAKIQEQLSRHQVGPDEIEEEVLRIAGRGDNSRFDSLSMVDCNCRHPAAGDLDRAHSTAGEDLDARDPGRLDETVDEGLRSAPNSAVAGYRAEDEVRVGARRPGTQARVIEGGCRQGGFQEIGFEPFSEPVCGAHRQDAQDLHHVLLAKAPQAQCRSPKSDEVPGSRPKEVRRCLIK